MSFVEHATEHTAAGPGLARCPYFGACGGCQRQDVAYAEQVAGKARELQELFGAFWAGPVPVTPSPVVWQYRNKVDPAFALKRYPEPPPEGFARETVLGFKRRGRWYWPLDIETCLIGPEGLEGLLAAVHAWYRAEGLRAWDNRSGTGFLRHLLVRDGKRTGERMVVLLTQPGDFDPAPFVEAVQRSYPATSIYRGITDRQSDVAVADTLELLDGAPHIHERLEVPTGEGVRPLTFRISPFSFFQTNSLATEHLYGTLRRWVKDTGARTLYDLYGGSGGIAFSCSGLVDTVTSVESWGEASEDGRYNAAANGIDNVTFITEKVKNFLKFKVEPHGAPPNSAMIVDPPRAGLHPKALKRILNARPGHLLYVSCNPKILARELPGLLEGYRLTRLQAFDLFPHTRHVEVAAAFEAA